MRALRRLALSCLLLSSLSFLALRHFEGGGFNWRPISLPLPGPGLEVAWPFSISTAGKYQLELYLPAQDESSDLFSTPKPRDSGVNVPNQSVPSLSPVISLERIPIPCDLQLQILGPNGFAINKSIKQLNHSGGYPFGHLEFYTSDSFQLLRSGKYTFRLRNFGKSEILSTHGASVVLTQFERPVEWILLNGLLGISGLGLLVLGLLTALAIEIQEFRHQSSRTDA